MTSYLLSIAIHNNIFISMWQLAGWINKIVNLLIIKLIPHVSPFVRNSV